LQQQLTRPQWQYNQYYNIGYKIMAGKM